MSYGDEFVDRELEKVEKLQRLEINMSRTFSAVLTVLLVIMSLYAAGIAYDYFRLTTDGFRLEDDMSYNALSQINPDLVAWLSLEGTNINHPIVQGRDNFEYLAIGFDGKDYAGGTLFLDADNKKDFSDDYNIIHGHHMSMGAMFGDLGKFLDRDFFDEFSEGVLKTPERNYKLRVVGVAAIDAYDSMLIPGEFPEDIDCIYKREFTGKKIVALATCTVALNDDRTVVLCEMTPTEGRWS